MARDEEGDWRRFLPSQEMKHLNCRKRISVIVGTSIIIAVLSILALVPIGIVKETDATRWMSRIDDDAKIIELSIPGTHDSGALHSIGDVAGKCQDLTIEEQLKIGVRFLDIRLQLVRDELRIVHSFVDQATSFKEVMADIARFLRENPSEMLIVSIKEDADAVDSALSFSDAVSREMKAYEEIVARGNVLPETLGEARGKMWVIARYGGNEIGISAGGGWQDSTTFELNGMYIQDNYCVDSAEEKIDDIDATLRYSAANSEHLVLNFSSCYLDNAFPPSYAGTAAKAVNGWLLKGLAETEGSTGILIMDFVTSELAKTVYERNLP